MSLLPAGELTRQVAERLIVRDRVDRHRSDATPAPDVIAPTSHTWLGSPLAEVLRLRHAVRRFTTDAVTQHQLRAILAAARTAENILWPHDSRGGCPIATAVAALRIDEVPVGMYLVRPHDSETDDAELVALPAPTTTLAVLRQTYADAAVLLFQCADLSRADQTGDGGYARLLTRCGSAAYAAWLKAIDEGLAGCLYGRTSHLVDTSIRAHDKALRHMFTVSLGIPDNTECGSSGAA